MDEFDDKKRKSSNTEDNNFIVVTDETDDLFDISDLLKKQVLEELAAEQQGQDKTESKGTSSLPKKKKLHRVLKVVGISFGAFLLVILLLVGTKPGRSLLYNAASHIILSYMNEEDETTGNLSGTLALTIDDILSDILLQKDVEQEESVETTIVNARQEENVKNYLIFGIEEIEGARNTDSMMIASLNMEDSSIKLTSLMRDTYAEIPGWMNNKLNSAYARGGTTLLITTIEHNYKIKIDGYAYVNFASFEQIIDYLGKIPIELTQDEANYLNKENYISNPANRNVHAGVNELNGNQVLGYCRVRKVATLGGANNDYGRTVRHRRVMNAIFEKCKSKSIIELFMMLDDCLGMVTSNVSASQIQEAISYVVENGITELEQLRIPVDEMFDSPKVYEGITYPLVLDWEANIKELYKFIYNDTDMEAQAAYDELQINN